MALLATVAADRNTAILDKAGRGETLEVLLRALRPALGELRTTGLSRQLDRENILAVGIANKIDDGKALIDLLPLCNQIHTEALFAQALFDSGQAELVSNSASVGTQADAEGIEVFLLGGIDKSSPGSLSLHLRYTSPIDDALLLAVHGNMALLVAQLALLRIGRAVASGMTLNTAAVADAREGVLDTRVGTVGLVVAYLTTVVAFASEAAALGLVRTLAGEVASLVAAAKI
jgi:hypothetical protein